LNRAVSTRLRERIKSLPSEMYRAETRRFLAEFLKAPFTDEAHKLMVSAFFVWEHRTSFWQNYWQTIAGMLINTSEAKRVVDLLTFWFTVPPYAFQQRYLLQDFCLVLPRMLGEIRKLRSFQEASQVFPLIAGEQLWYPVVQDFFVERKNTFLAVGQ